MSKELIPDKVQHLVNRASMQGCLHTVRRTAYYWRWKYVGQNDESEAADMERSCQRNQGEDWVRSHDTQGNLLLFARMLLW